MARHRVFVIAADVKSGCEKALRDDLEILNRALDDVNVAATRGYVGPTLRFSSLEMLHYASFVVFDGAKLGGTIAKLVFECNIDDSEWRFFDLLLDDPAIDDIYEHCEGYDRHAAKAVKVKYLKDRQRRPQLFHVGAPYRSVESIKRDRELRRRLDAELDELMEDSLGDYRARTPSGMREYWGWEILKPWVAWLIAATVPGAAIGLSYVAFQRQSTLVALGITLALAAAGFVGGVAARKMWVTALPDLRDRVRPWLRWAVVALLLGAISWRLRSHHRNWALGVIVVFLLLAVQSASAAIYRRWNEKLLEIRANSTMPVTDLWRVLKKHAIEIHDRSEWFTRFVNWMAWPGAYLVTFALVWSLEPHRWRLVGVLTALLFLKSLWLSVLVGWPAPRTKNEPPATDKAITPPEEAIKSAEAETPAQPDLTRIRMFSAAVAIGAAAGLWILTELHAPAWFVALAVLVGFFTLWAMPLPSPAVPLTKLKTDDLATILAPEDRGVQNHMAAVVVLHEDHRYRVPFLRFFLWLLNRFYFRCILPDIFRGKLWGLPTVQFAQWVLLDRRNYLFLSNYDNSWTSYLDDFGLHVTTGVQKIWGQGVNNPGTKDLTNFKNYARTTMVTHSLWYRAYPGLSLRQVWNNEEIRRGLATAKGEEAMVRTLRRLGASPKILPDQLHAGVK